MARKGYEGSRRAEDINPEPGKFIQPVRPSTAPVGGGLRRDSRPRHQAPEEVRDRPAKTAKPRKVDKVAPRTPPAPTPRAAAVPAGPRAARRLRVAADEGHAYAVRQAYRATNGKPSVTGRAVAGGAAGAATGATVGSVVPVVGTAVGTGAGAAIGATTGAVAGARAKRAYKAAMRESPRARQLIVAEFAACMVVAGLSPLTDTKKGEKPGAFMRRMTALMGLFFLLGLMTTAGRGAAKAAAAFGGLVTVGLLVSERNLFVKLAAAFAPDVNDAEAAGSGPGPSGGVNTKSSGADLQAAARIIPGRRTASAPAGRGDLP